MTVSAQDELNGSGLAETRCVLDPGWAPAQFDELPSDPCPYLDGRTVAATGTHVLYAASRDRFGNDGAVVTLPFKLDTVAPALLVPSSVEVDAPTPGGTSVDYHYRAVDDFAGEVPGGVRPRTRRLLPRRDHDRRLRGCRSGRQRRGPRRSP